MEALHWEPWIFETQFLFMICNFFFRGYHLTTIQASVDRACSVDCTSVLSSNSRSAIGRLLFQLTYHHSVWPTKALFSELSGYSSTTYTFSSFKQTLKFHDLLVKLFSLTSTSTNRPIPCWHSCCHTCPYLSNPTMTITIIWTTSSLALLATSSVASSALYVLFCTSVTRDTRWLTITFRHIWLNTSPLFIWLCFTFLFIWNFSFFTHSYSPCLSLQPTLTHHLSLFTPLSSSYPSHSQLPPRFIIHTHIPHTLLQSTTHISTSIEHSWSKSPIPKYPRTGYTSTPHRFTLKLTTSRFSRPRLHTISAQPDIIIHRHTKVNDVLNFTSVRQVHLFVVHRPVFVFSP